MRRAFLALALLVCMAPDCPCDVSKNTDGAGHNPDCHPATVCVAGESGKGYCFDPSRHPSAQMESPGVVLACGAAR